MTEEEQEAAFQKATQLIDETGWDAAREYANKQVTHWKAVLEYTKSLRGEGGW